MEFITSIHNKRKLLNEGYVYLFQKTLSGGVQNWECEHRRKGELDESLVRAEIAQVLGGYPAPPQRRRYADSAVRILNIVRDYNSRPLLGYLRAIANNLQF